MENEVSPFQLEIDSLVTKGHSMESLEDHRKRVISRVKEHIYSPRLIKNVTLYYPFKQGEKLDKFRDETFKFQDLSLVISNVSLTSLTDLEFINGYLRPKRLTVFNIYDTSFSKIRFLINSEGKLFLLLDLDVFRSLGLANCKVVNRNKDESVTVEVDLSDPRYTVKESKMYERLQKSLSKITPTSVLVCSETSRTIEVSELRKVLEKSSNSFKLTPCYSKFEHFRVHFGKKESPQSLMREAVNWLESESTCTLEEGSRKRRKTDLNKSDLNSRVEKANQYREVLVKIFNTLKKNTPNKGQLVKDMVHELNQKNIHTQLEMYTDDSKHPVNRVLEFLDELNLETVKESGKEDKPRGSEWYELLRVRNGVISKETAFNLFKNSWDSLMEETGLFVMSIYTMSERKMIAQPLVQGPEYGSYQHILCGRLKDPEQVVTLFIKSK